MLQAMPLAARPQVTLAYSFIFHPAETFLPSQVRKLAQF